MVRKIFSARSRPSVGSLGASNIKEMYDVEIIIAQSFQSEGKVFQMSRKIGMGK
jgi:IMP dehydrogenase